MSDHGHGPVENPFTEHQLAEMHGDDQTAARAIIFIMTSIFVLGVLGYTYVAWWVAAGWGT